MRQCEYEDFDNLDWCCPENAIWEVRCPDDPSYWLCTYHYDRVSDFYRKDALDGYEDAISMVRLNGW